MKIMVTGSAGFLGREVVSQLRKSNLEVIPVARRADAYTECCDLQNIKSLLALLEDKKPDVVVNCAAQADWGKNKLAQLFTVNALVPSVLADWCGSNNSYLLQISGTLVYGTSVTTVVESALETPDTDYGISKLLADQMIRASGATAGIIRFGGIFGGGGPDHLGINRAIRMAKSGELPELIGSGAARRNYIHVVDAAKLLRFCINNRLEGVHIAGGKEVLSVKKMLQIICDIYLDGQHPKRVDGNDGRDQIVVSSDSLPNGSSFKESLLYEA